jgi:hypothetical protein
VSDADFINEKWNKTIQKFLEDYNKWEKHTLKENIIELAEIIELKIDNGLLNMPKSNISSYLYGELKKQEIEVSDRTIQRSLPPIFKKTEYGQKPDTMSTSHESIWTIVSTPESSNILEEDQYGNLRKNGILQENKREKRESLSEVFSVDVKPFIEDTYNTILNASKTCNRWEAFFSAICEYYMDRHTAPIVIDRIRLTDKIKENEKQEYIDEFEKRIKISEELHNYVKKSFTKQDQLFFAEHLSKAETARKEVDKREKWGNYSKVLMHYLTTIVNKANLAEIVGYCSKYASIGIERNEEVLRFYNWLLSCPKCNADIHYTMNEVIEEELRLDEAGLPSKVLPRQQITSLV